MRPIVQGRPGPSARDSRRTRAEPPLSRPNGAFDAASAQGRALTIAEGVAFAARTERLQRTPAPAVKTQPRTVLTRRELDIAQLVADNLSNRQIAASLFLSERTIEAHITNIFNKQGLNARTQISRWLTDADEVP